MFIYHRKSKVLNLKKPIYTSILTERAKNHLVGAFSSYICKKKITVKVLNNKLWRFLVQNIDQPFKYPLIKLSVRFLVI